MGKVIALLFSIWISGCANFQLVNVDPARDRFVETFCSPETLAATNAKMREPLNVFNCRSQMGQLYDFIKAWR
jgi:hypothetical protein